MLEYMSNQSRIQVRNLLLQHHSEICGPPCAPAEDPEDGAVEGDVLPHDGHHAAVRVRRRRDVTCCRDNSLEIVLQGDPSPLQTLVGLTFGLQ